MTVQFEKMKRGSVGVYIVDRTHGNLAPSSRMLLTNTFNTYAVVAPDYSLASLPNVHAEAAERGD
jgi:hypothetical protein